MTKAEAKSISLLLSTVGLVAIAFLAIVIGGVILLNKSKVEIRDLSSQNYVLENNLTERDSLVNELVVAFDTIESSLTYINKRRSQLIVENKETLPNQQEVIIRDIRMMDNMLEENSKKIEELEKKLTKSGIQLNAFKNKIASLNKCIEQQNIQIVEFKAFIQDQNTKLTMANQQNDILQNEVLAVRDSIQLKEEMLAQKNEIITEQVYKMNKGYFASGTYKELYENGVVEKEGGFLGIGKNKILQNSLNEDYFTQVDITENRTISLNAKKINLISEHPINSYRLIEEDGLITKLEIKTPEDFWRISHYAVIEVK